jgi:hypothetical protein
MKLHNNSWFGGVFVVPVPYRNLIKSEGLIEGAGGLVGRPDFEKNRTFRGSEIGRNQRASHALAAPIGGHSQVQNLVFTGRQCTAYQEANDVDPGRRHQQIEVQVLSGIPLRGLGARCLYAEDCPQVTGLAAPHDRHFGKLAKQRATYIFGA